VNDRGPLSVAEAARTDLMRALEPCLRDRTTQERLDAVALAFRLVAATHAQRDLVRDYWPRNFAIGRPEPGMLAYDAFMEREVVEPVRNLILRLAPVPGRPSSAAADGRGDLIELAQLYLLAADGFRLVRGSRIVPLLRDELGQELFARVDRYRRHITEALHEADHPDVPAMVRDLMMMEIIRFVLDTLRHEKLSRDIGFMWRSFARRALARATEAVEQYLSRRDLMSRYGANSILAEIEDLSTLVTQILEGDREAASRESGNAFLRDLGAEAVQRFLDGLVAVVRIALEEGLPGHHDPLLDGQSTADRVRRVIRLMTFAERIAGRDPVSVAGDQAGQIRAILQDLADHAQRQAATPGSQALLAAKDLIALHDLARQFRWQDDAATLADRLVRLAPIAREKSA
jgi:hypothetical protein